jgi:hypothetical protein
MLKTLVRSRGWRRIALAAAFLLGAPASSPAATVVSVQGFVDTIGVNTHMSYAATPYRDVPAVSRDLEFIGVRHVRDHLPLERPGGGNPAFGPMKALAARGVRFTFVVGGGGPARPFDPERVVATAKRFSAAAPGSVEAIEGFNETNNWPVHYGGEKGDAAAETGMRALYQAVKADPALRDIPVYDMTGTQRVASLAGRADFANLHPYPRNGGRARFFYKLYDRGEDQPRVATEVGNFTLPADWPGGRAWWAGSTMLGVDELTQAKSILDALFWAAQRGVTRTYVYELLDEGPDPSHRSAEQHFGLFRPDHSPKPAATALHNLTDYLKSIPADRDAGAPAEVPVRIAAETDVNQLLISGGKNVFLAALWTNDPYWSWGAGAAGPAPSRVKRVRVDLTRPVVRAVRFDPLDGKRVTLDVKGTALEVPVEDHPTLLELQF